MTAFSKIYEALEHIEEQVECPVGSQAVVYSARSPDKVTANEDCAAVIDAGDGAVVLAVADGLGG